MPKRKMHLTGQMDLRFLALLHKHLKKQIEFLYQCLEQGVGIISVIGIVELQTAYSINKRTSEEAVFSNTLLIGTRENEIRVVLSTFITGEQVLSIDCYPYTSYYHEETYAVNFIIKRLTR